MKPRSAKNKGKRLQNEIRELLLENFQELEEDDILSTTIGESGEDLKLSPAARKVIPFSPECKNQEKTQIWEWLKQAEINADKKNSYPILFFRRNRSKTYAVVEVDIFVKMLRIINSANKNLEL